MSRINWNTSGTRKYETGVDRGVLYIGSQPGVPWNGLTSITENSSGGVAKPFYLDGEKYLNIASREEFQATISAYTYPDEFAECDGTASVRPGLLITKQRRKSFGLSYRTLIGNDTSDNYAYKIHIIYNVLASPSNPGYKSIANSIDPNDFSWTLSSLPPVISGYRRTSHFIVDSRHVNPTVLAALEDILYGDTASSSRLPFLDELTDLIDTGAVLTVVDNGDGTFTLTAPMAKLSMLDSFEFQLTWPTAVFVDADTYTASS